MTIKEKLIKILISYDKLLPHERLSMQNLISQIKSSELDEAFHQVSDDNLKSIASLMQVFYFRGANDIYKKLNEENNTNN